MQTNRIDRLEEKFRPESDGVESITLRVCYDQTFFDENGERCSRTLPATYDESVPFSAPHWNPEKGCWTRMRVLYPLEDAADPGSGGVPDNTVTSEADHGIVRDAQVTGD